MTAAFSTGEVLAALAPGTASLVESVIAEARKSNLEIHLVGGPVRDLLLGRAIRDVDLVLQPRGDANSATVARAAAPAAAKVTVHDRFGTASIATPEGELDLTDARSETYSHPGALPQVSAGSLEDDLRRRDFAVNAMALPLAGSRSKRRFDVIDPCSGLADLEAGRLSILHPGSFHDDPTRALRAARLGPRLGFSLARGSRTALRNALRDGAFGRVSGDRIRREMDRCFEDARWDLDPALALRKLSEWHVLSALEPGLTLPASAIAPLRRLGRFVQAPAWPGPRIRAGISGYQLWLADLPPGLRRRLVERLSLRGVAVTRIAQFARLRDSCAKQLRSARGRGAVDAILAELDEESLVALYAAASTPVRRRIVRWAAEDRGLRTPVTGADLVSAGLSGPAVGRALARIRSSFLDGALANREEALALARELARRKPTAAKGRKSPRA